MGWSKGQRRAAGVGGIGGTAAVIAAGAARMLGQHGDELLTASRALEHHPTAVTYLERTLTRFEGIGSAVVLDKIDANGLTVRLQKVLDDAAGRFSSAVEDAMCSTLYSYRLGGRPASFEELVTGIAARTVGVPGTAVDAASVVSDLNRVVNGSAPLGYQVQRDAAANIAATFVCLQP